MQSPIKNPNGFDYGDLEPDAIEYIEMDVELIKTSLHRTATEMVKIGKALERVKSQLLHGQFGDWLQAKFKMSHQTANNFMAVARQFPDGVPEGIAPTALYILARSQTPEAVRQEAVARAEAGEEVSPLLARALQEAARVVEGDLWIYVGPTVKSINEATVLLTPGAEVQIGSTSLGDRNKCFVRQPHIPNFVFQVQRDHLLPKNQPETTAAVPDCQDEEGRLLRWDGTVYRSVEEKLSGQARDLGLPAGSGQVLPDADRDHLHTSPVDVDDRPFVTLAETVEVENNSFFTITSDPQNPHQVRLTMGFLRNDKDDGLVRAARFLRRLEKFCLDYPEMEYIYPDGNVSA